jgi:putative nucleotidyltransferase with HDIG domain
MKGGRMNLRKLITMLRDGEREKIVGTFPDLQALGDCPENQKHHSSADVLSHTLNAVTRGLRAGASPTVLTGLLFHDIGKPLTHDTSKGDDHFPKHGKLGAELFDAQIRPVLAGDTTDNAGPLDEIRTLIELHERVFQLASGDYSLKAWRRLEKSCGSEITFSRLLELATCDNPKNKAAILDAIMLYDADKESAGKAEAEKKRRAFTGSDLKAILADLGKDIKGRDFGTLLNEVNNLSDQDATEQGGVVEAAARKLDLWS